MTKALTFLDEKRIYVSWGILCLVIAATAMLTKIMIQQDQMILNQAKYEERQDKLDGRVSKIEATIYFNKVEENP